MLVYIYANIFTSKMPTSISVIALKNEWIFKITTEQNYWPFKFIMHPDFLKCYKSNVMQLLGATFLKVKYAFDHHDFK